MHRFFQLSILAGWSGCSVALDSKQPIFWWNLSKENYIRSMYILVHRFWTVRSLLSAWWSLKKSVETNCWRCCQGLTANSDMLFVHAKGHELRGRGQSAHLRSTEVISAHRIDTDPNLWLLYVAKFSGWNTSKMYISITEEHPAHSSSSRFGKTISNLISSRYPEESGPLQIGSVCRN